VNRARGIATERDLARYLRVNGWPNAERKQDNGWAARDRVSPDAGDIRNTPGLCWQAKSSPELSGQMLSTALRQTAEQVLAAGADYGIVVHRRVGHASPARWWAYLPLGDLFALLSLQGRNLSADPLWNAPIRLELANLVSLLHRAGFGIGIAA